MNVTLRQLQVFVAVSDTLHFTRAADSLHLSQSSVSTQIRELEECLGFRLFDRHTRMLRLTEAGSEILPLARKAVADLESVIGSSAQIKTLRRGRVSMAVASVQAALVVPRVVREFTDANPGIKVVIHDVPQDVVLTMVRAGEVDFGLGTASGSRHDLGVRRLWGEVFVAVLPPGHPLTRQPRLTWRDLQDAPVIGPSSDNPVREQLDFALAREGISLSRLYEVSLPLTMVGMVEGGLGIGVMTISIAKVAQALDLVLRPVTAPTIEREVSLLFHPDRSLSPAAQTLCDLIHARRAELAPREGEPVRRAVAMG
ncbi:LysR family transcriptional regulator [Ramlibacter rhizophilus]|uniref:LysR family transcriptional regulator n=2 Tax=Ramlibacter rhizophilus TaxID=1781167 RepID=A0A4Z0BTW4_9BURK|nr:LysR family transcriptional regulator [Ramlibacter rhizophilus]TFZ01688.1 LysR family transcriptional regulator [Ramlibacter rhizophilus]